MECSKLVFPTFASSGSQGQSKDSPSADENAYELNLISQYLAFNDQSQQQPPKYGAQQRSAGVQFGEESGAGREEGACKKPSSFHNFQKHLINTLKNSVKLKKIRNIQTSRLRIAYELWQYFVSSAKCTKKLLYAILGDELANSTGLEKSPSNQNCELHQLLSQLEPAQIAAAQTYLRNLIVKQSRNLLKGKLLKGRRMQRSQDFKKYFEQFVSELESGSITRRLSKDKKKQLLASPLSTQNKDS